MVARNRSTGTSEMVEKHAVHNGDIYVCGYFEKTVVIGGTTFTSRGETDIFLYKARPDGTIIWARTLGGSNYDGDVGLDVDDEGNVYLAGGFTDRLYYQNSVLLTAGNSYWSSFFSKFDPDGNHLWTKGIITAGQFAEVRVWGNISVNKTSMVIAIQAGGSILLDNELISNSGNAYLVIAKFDLHGNRIWTKRPEGVHNCRKIYLDDSDNCYLTGTFGSEIKFDSYTLNGHPTHSDVYTTKLDRDGKALWLKGAIKTTTRIDNNWSRSLTVDPAGNVYVIGTFKGNVAFDNITLQGNTDPEYSIIDTFIAKYNENGELLRAVNFGDSYHAWGADIVSSPYGLYVLGNLSGTMEMFYCRIDESLPEEVAPVRIDVSGLALQLSAASLESFYISGTAAFIQGQLTNGSLDAALIKIQPCVTPMPGNLSPIAGDQTACVGEEVTYSVTPVADADNYIWTIPSIFSPSGEIRTGEHNIKLKVLATGEAMISVSALNECSRTNRASTLNIKTDVMAEPPIITKEACDAAVVIDRGENIQWFRNSELIPGATQNRLPVSAPGVYHAAISNVCSSTLSTEVTVEPVKEINESAFPNVITPDDDGLNDSFQLHESLLQSPLRIFNRWGEIIYESSSYKNTWPGENVSGGVYFYYVRSSCYPTGFKGTLHVIK